jgi:hypothetical protein
MSDLDGQRRKRPGNRAHIDRIKGQMDQEVLRDRVIKALLSVRCDLEEPCEDCRILACQDADAVIAALNLAVAVEYLSVDGSRQNYMVAGHYTVER